jgi:hypothetical protein
MQPTPVTPSVTPNDPLVADLVNGLAPDLREDFEERAGIIEHDGQFLRGHAECLALLDLLRRYPAALTGITVLQVELDGASEWLLTINPDLARQYLADLGGNQIVAVDLADVVWEQYGGMAMLTTLG